MQPITLQTIRVLVLFWFFPFFIRKPHDNPPYFVKFAHVVMGLTVCMITIDFTYLLT
jgi:hypothetical protein